MWWYGEPKLWGTRHTHTPPEDSHGYEIKLDCFGAVNWTLIQDSTRLVKSSISSLLNDGGGRYIWCPSPPANFLLPWTFWLIFFEAVGNMVKSWGKISRKSNLMFNKRYFRNTLFYPATTYSRLCSSEDMHENSDPSRFFDPRRDLLIKNLGSIGHFQKLCKLFPLALFRATLNM